MRRRLSIIVAGCVLACPVIAWADGMVILDGGTGSDDSVLRAPRVGADGRIYLILGAAQGCSVAVLDASGTFASAFEGEGTRQFTECPVDLDVGSPTGNLMLRYNDVQRTDSALDPFWTSP